MLRFSAQTGVFSIDDQGGYQSRNYSTTHLITDALRLARPNLLNSFSIGVITDDFLPAADRSTRCLAYCRTAEQDNVTAIPDHLFWSWPETGIDDYESTIDQTLAHSAKSPTDDRLFWIGNQATHVSRRRFLELTHGDSRVCAQSMDWSPPSSQGPTGTPLKPTGGFTSLPGHCEYRFLIDLQGRGYSGRLKILLFSGRPLLVPDRIWREYFFDDLKPFEHYIPVREDLSDLFSQLDWALAHPAECDAIAQRAQHYAQSHLRRIHAVQYLAKILIECSNS